MKKHLILFWITTGLFSAFMLFSAYNYLATNQMKEAFEQFGFPDYFRVELGIAKLLGALALILPSVPRPFKIFAYVGFTINLVSAVIAHLGEGHPISSAVFPVVVLIVLGVSYYTYSKLWIQSDKGI